MTQRKNVSPLVAAGVILGVLIVVAGLYMVLGRRAAPEATPPDVMKAQMQQMMKGQQQQFGMMKGGEQKAPVR